MTKYEFDDMPKELPAEIADFTVGFAVLSTHEGIEDARLAGSGTFVTVGPIEGILTAAHVLRELPDSGPVGLVLFSSASPFPRKTTINIGLAKKLIIPPDTDGLEWPDLGFLRIPSLDVSDLKTRHNFFNLGRRRESVLAGDRPDPPYFDGLSGAIDEWTKDLPEERGVGVKGFNALYGVGVVVGERQSGDFDLMDFEVTYGPGSASPDSYGGMSGGALWRVWLTKDDKGQTLVRDKKVFGVACHQSELADQKRIITCHGPRSVYGKLIDAIQEEWPE